MIYTNLIFAMTAIPSLAMDDPIMGPRNVMGHLMAEHYVRDNRTLVHRMRQDLTELLGEKFANTVNNYALGGQWANSGDAEGMDLAWRVKKSVKYIEVLHELATQRPSKLTEHHIKRYLSGDCMSFEELQKEFEIDIQERGPAKQIAEARRRSKSSRSNTGTPTGSTAEELGQQVANMKKCSVWDYLFGCFCKCTQSDDLSENSVNEQAPSDVSSVSDTMSLAPESDRETESEYSNNEPTDSEEDDEKYPHDERKTNDDDKPDHIAIEVQELVNGNAPNARQIEQPHKIHKDPHVRRNSQHHTRRKPAKRNSGSGSFDCGCCDDCIIA